MPYLNENTRANTCLDFPKARKQTLMQMCKECFQSTAYLQYAHKRIRYVIKQVIAFVLLFFQIKITHVKPKSQLPRSPQVLQTYCNPYL